jgi:hypothetical protein
LRRVTSLNFRPLASPMGSPTSADVSDDKFAWTAQNKQNLPSLFPPSGEPRAE